MRYQLEHQGTAFGTGSFAPLPVENLDFEEALAYLQEHPNDQFMHQYLLNLAGKFGPNLTGQLIARGMDDHPHLLALMYEACILNDRLHPLTERFRGTDFKQLAQYTPLIYVNWSLNKDRDKNAYWLKLFSDNILRHRQTTPSQPPASPIPFDPEAIDRWHSQVVPVTKLLGQEEIKASTIGATPNLGPEGTATMAMERVKAAGFKTGREMKNLASLSPYALQIPWYLEVTVSTEKNHWQLAGTQTSYGKGLNWDQARASCWMEVVERVSAFASFDEGGALHYKHGHPLMKGRYEDLKNQSCDLLDPNDMSLEVPYENQPLHWVSGTRVDETGEHPVYVPAQLVFLFCNLDEICLTSGLPSTGLASGNTLEEAKLHGLLEVIERDAERVMPYTRERCFVLDADGPPVQRILQHGRQTGVQVLDITSEFGLPCYKAFVQSPNGEIFKGCAAHLDGKRAMVSALTELPFHPSWFHPTAIPEDLGTLRHENLPDYCSGHVGQDLRLVERLLLMNGYRPVYVNLTRRDLDIPVVKALIPGLELLSDFDRFSPLSLRQFAHYFQALNQQQS
ncbi:MAG: YcaO-like family protein [Deltaproteobacteria bacterium]|jgi:YcaO-like protein with predicted kinase domain